MGADTAAARSVVATVAVADAIATTAPTAEAPATEAVDNQDMAMVEEEAPTAEAMAPRLLQPTVAAHNPLLLLQPPPLLNLPPQQ
jgi:hypothetical protein